MSNRTLQGNYVTSGRFMRDCDREHAETCRNVAHRVLRIGWRNEHGYWMRRAMRYWRYYADAQRKLTDANN